MRYICRLAGWRHTCDEGYQDHHMVSKGDLRGNPEARKFVEKKHPGVFLVPTCGFANRTRLADTKEGTAILFRNQRALFTPEYFDPIYEELRQMFKDPLLGIPAILASLPEDDPGSLW